MSRQDEMLDVFVKNNTLYLNQVLKSRRGRLLFALSPRLRKLRAKCEVACTSKSKNVALALLLDSFEDLPVNRMMAWLLSIREDIGVLLRQWGKRAREDRSDKQARDYYSVATIVKNEARYIREFVLFYQATGADRIYLYDNDSTDNLHEVLQPFIEAGYVVYQKWPGRSVQTAAYRDAIRRTRRKTTWLAIVDADEFLFSPNGSMPGQLKAYEQYSGVGVNWIVYGPNGHVSRPDGLVMDNYTTTFADHNEGINHHIKSIVQPRKVLCMRHTHFALYRGKCRAVSEDGCTIDNYSSFQPRAGKAFTREVHRNVFRINHYLTRSLEDLDAKSQRGYADGTPNRTYENELIAFQRPQIKDYSIKPFADLVRTQ